MFRCLLLPVHSFSESFPGEGDWKSEEIFRRSVGALERVVLGPPISAHYTMQVVVQERDDFVSLSAGRRTGIQVRVNCGTALRTLSASTHFLSFSAASMSAHDGARHRCSKR